MLRNTDSGQMRCHCPREVSTYELLTSATQVIVGWYNVEEGKYDRLCANFGELQLLLPSHIMINSQLTVRRCD